MKQGLRCIEKEVAFIMKNANTITLTSFSIGHCSLALKQSALVQVKAPVEVTAIPFSANFIDGVVNIEGEVIPQINLANLLQLELNPNGSQPTLLIVGEKSKQLAFLVDKIMQDYHLNPAHCLDVDQEKKNHHLYHGIFRQPEVLYWLNDAAIISQLTQQQAQNSHFVTDTFSAPKKSKAVATIDVLKVSIGNEQKAFKVPCIKEVVDVEHWVPSLLGPDFFIGFTQHQGLTIPLVTSADHPNIKDLLAQNLLATIIMQKKGKVLGLVVDQILELTTLKQDAITAQSGSLKRGFIDADQFIELLHFEQLYDQTQWQKINGFLPQPSSQQQQHEPSEQLVLIDFSTYLIGIPLKQVKRIMPAQNIQPLMQNAPFMAGVIDFEGEATPVFNLHELFAGKLTQHNEMLVIEQNQQHIVLNNIKADRIVNIRQSAIQYIEDSHVNRFIGYSQWKDQLIKITDCRFIQALTERELS